MVTPLRAERVLLFDDALILLQVGVGLTRGPGASVGVWGLAEKGLEGNSREKELGLEGVEGEVMGAERQAVPGWRRQVGVIPGGRCAAPGTSRPQHLPAGIPARHHLSFLIWKVGCL